MKQLYGADIAGCAPARGVQAEDDAGRLCLDGGELPPVLEFGWPGSKLFNSQV
jgi:hypothetical protein